MDLRDSLQETGVAFYLDSRSKIFFGVLSLGVALFALLFVFLFKKALGSDVVFLLWMAVLFLIAFLSLYQGLTELYKEKKNT
jgi:hypothetical protein